MAVYHAGSFNKCFRALDFYGNDYFHVLVLRLLSDFTAFHHFQAGIISQKL
jgi:hypothetical protein